jgi:hypothetical protein
VEARGSEAGNTFRLLAMRKLESRPLLETIFRGNAPTPTKTANPAVF